MNILGEIKNLRAAQAFSDYLRSQGIANKLNPIGDPADQRIQICILKEDQLPNAAEELKSFIKNVNDPKYRAASWKVSNDDNASLSPKSQGSIIPKEKLSQTGPVTLSVMIFCIAIYGLTNFLFGS